nr:hypothetical protein [uncultured Celeribacter sp.]
MRLSVFLMAGALLLAGCQSDQGDTAPDYGLAGYDPGAVEAQRRACEAKGGEFRAAGMAGLMTCFTTPPDAGKSCRKSSDCSSNTCLARSGTCAPISPLFGCNDLLDAEGRRGTLCVD